MKAALFAVIIKAIIWPLAYIILAKGDTKLYFKQEILSDFFVLVATLLLYHFFGLVVVGIASLFQFIIYGVYIINILNKKFDFAIRKDTFKIILVCFFVGLASCIITFTIDYPYAYYPLGSICILSTFYSYKELDKRIDLFSYYLKIKNKFKRNE